MMFERVIFVLFLLFSKDLVSSLRLVELRVPTHEREGGSALLGCQYDLEGDMLYSIKWYKDGKEFYRYAPKNIPPIRHFNKPGVYVDETRSSGTVVALVNLTSDSAGMYTCEVSGEAPSFTSIQTRKYIKIHLIPDTGPRVTGLREQYYIDDQVIANCTSPPSRPEAHLKWLVNDKLVPSQYTHGPWRTRSIERPDAVEITLQLNLNVSPADFIGGAMTLKCQATIAPLYQRETSSIHYAPRPFPVSTDGNGYAVNVKHSISSLMLPVFLLIVVI